MADVLQTEYEGKIERIVPLITEEMIRDRIVEMGRQIRADFEGQGEVVLVGVLKGAFLFFADLIRAIDLPLLACDFLGLSSYGSRTASSGVVRLTSDLTKPVQGKHVLVIEDIVDTGLTMNYLIENLKTRRPASVNICTLLDKPSGRQVDVDVRYVGFSIEDYFVVGYGLDYDERYRNLPYIGVMHFDPLPGQER